MSQPPDRARSHGHHGGPEAEPSLARRAAGPAQASAVGAARAGVHGGPRRGAPALLEALHLRGLPAAAPHLALLLPHAVPATQRGGERVDAPAGRSGAAAPAGRLRGHRGLLGRPARPAPLHHCTRLLHLPLPQRPGSPPAGQIRVLALQLLLPGLRGRGRVPVWQRPGTLLLRHRALLARPGPGHLPAHGGLPRLAVLHRLLLQQVQSEARPAGPLLPGGALRLGLRAGHQPRGTPHPRVPRPCHRRPRPSLSQVPSGLLPVGRGFLLGLHARALVPWQLPRLWAGPPDLSRLPGAVHAGSTGGCGAGLRGPAAHLRAPAHPLASQLLRPFPAHGGQQRPHRLPPEPAGSAQTGPEGPVNGAGPGGVGGFKWGGGSSISGSAPRGTRPGKVACVWPLLILRTQLSRQPGWPLDLGG